MLSSLYFLEGILGFYNILHIILGDYLSPLFPMGGTLGDSHLNLIFWRLLKPTISSGRDSRLVHQLKFNVWRFVKLPIPAGRDVRLLHLLKSNVWRFVKPPISPGRDLRFTHLLKSNFGRYVKRPYFRW